MVCSAGGSCAAAATCVAVAVLQLIQVSNECTSVLQPITTGAKSARPSLLTLLLCNPQQRMSCRATAMASLCPLPRSRA